MTFLAWLLSTVIAAAAGWYAHAARSGHRTVLKALDTVNAYATLSALVDAIATNDIGQVNRALDLARRTLNQPQDRP